ncbi:gluconate 2-dehydrogenase subunit 3 family protein [Lichenibacterium dinghuense]|uniref:gluconate 2-dehydrogenase subunit 3 family protein n=1 Tax=Lichenibacterium dinghuense TaxID=2895977 RepID=UPI001F3AF43A|nr:gluconate 2-dehydrogenase subunit 3 family protein [Lichenibacterium sp. 6Y81]
MTERSFPGYDVLDKRDTPSWNDATRSAIDARLAVPREPRFFTSDEFATLKAVCDRILPQPADRADPVPLAATVDAKIFEGKGDGYRFADLPPQGEAWRIGLAALDHEAKARHNARFRDLSRADRDGILREMQHGRLEGDHWRGMPLKLFFTKRIVHDVTDAYYGHPTAWNEIGFGGPAAPRGYVRMDKNRRDPWEAAEGKPGQEERALRENQHVV